MLRVSSFQRRLTLAALWVLTAACGRGKDAPWLTALDPAGHDAKFPIEVGPHAVDCNICHGDTDSFRNFTCINDACHLRPETDPLHSAVSEYEYGRETCYSCHPRGVGEISREDHQQYFPILPAAKHGAVECSSCHPDPSRRTDVKCIDCHPHIEPDTSSKHDLVGGYSWQSSSCLRCHYDASVYRVAGHQPFRIDPRSPHPPSRAECLRCHRASLAEKSWAADFEVFTCTEADCHARGETDGHHDDVGGYSYDSPTCVKSGCHPDGIKREGD